MIQHLSSLLYSTMANLLCTVSCVHCELALKTIYEISTFSNDCFCCSFDSLTLDLLNSHSMILSVQGRQEDWGGPQNGLCERSGGTPPGNFEILHAQKCGLAAPEALFRVRT